MSSGAEGTGGDGLGEGLERGLTGGDGTGSGWGKGSRGGRNVPGLLIGEAPGNPQAIKQSSGDNMRAGGSQARMGLPRWGLMGCRRGFRTLEEGQSWPVTVCCC